MTAASWESMKSAAWVFPSRSTIRTFPLPSVPAALSPTAPASRSTLNREESYTLFHVSSSSDNGLILSSRTFFLPPEKPSPASSAG